MESIADIANREGKAARIELVTAALASPQSRIEERNGRRLEAGTLHSHAFLVKILVPGRTHNKWNCRGGRSSLFNKTSVSRA
jgi:hypothetical protein